MSIPAQVYDLVERFDKHRADYKSGKYNETQVRREFIDPFFKALEWDVDNTQGYAEAYKDVVHEDAIKVGQATKAPDYSFRIGGIRKFFLEAKKPSVDIKHDTHPAYQLRRYGWSAKLPLSILTDFEEFAVYDCRVKPVKTDNAATARIMYLTYTDYIERWDELQSVFSPESIKTGSFDKYTASTKTKRGTAEVDAAFLQEIERWREILARNFALRNTLTQRELNYAVQLTIDRLIFLRIAEDRSIEPYGQLKALLKADNIYSNLVQLFARADDRYNAGLFHFKAEKSRNTEVDSLTPNLTLDDKVLNDIFKNLYYPDSPYEFSVLPADILGQVYEQFLGKVIRLTSGGRAKVEEKPEVKKAGGVFYTPTYIVDYIVKQTVGQLFEGQQIGTTGMGPVNRLRILDPACGSGSFLLGAYQYLLDWYLEEYRQSPKKWSRGQNPRLYENNSGEWQLTIAERKRILTTHIYGVDIDPQAVEVTKLSLLLKVLEDDKSVTQQLALFQERVLPDLDENIKCGNSLIGPDYYASNPTQMGMFGNEEEFYRINAFDWQTEFKDIMQAGGFDVVIGNPPYVRQEMLGEFKGYFQQNYNVYHGMADLYTYFIEKGISLLKPQGAFGYIVANKWLRANYGKPLRQWLKHQYIANFIDFGDTPVFPKATTYPCVLITRKDIPSSFFIAAQVDTLSFTNLENYIIEQSFKVNQDQLSDEGWSLVDTDTQALLTKIGDIGILLKDYVKEKIYYGVKTGLNKAFIIDSETRAKLIASDNKSSKLIKPFLAGRDIKRYDSPNSTRYLILIPKGWTNLNSGNSSKAWRWLTEHYPAIANYLSRFEEDAQKRYDKGDYWWELRACDYYDEFEKPKIMLPDISIRGNFTYDEDGIHYCVNTAYIIASKDKYLLGILNSQLITFYYKSLSATYRGGYLRFIYQYLIQLPIRTIDFNNPADVAQHDKMVGLVEQMLTLHQQLAQTTIPQQKQMLKRRIETTDRQIDTMVYELYGLIAEEIAIVEGSIS